MQSKPKSNSVITTEWNFAERAISWKVLGAGRATLHLNKLHPAILETAAYHGLTQRGSDRAAISRDPKTGRAASAEEKLQAIQEWVAHVESGTEQWAMREGSGAAASGLTYRAIAECTGGTLDQVRERVAAQAAKLEKTVQALLAEYRERPGRVRDAFLRLQAEGKPSGDDLLEGIGE